MDYLLFQSLNQFASRWLWLDALGIFFAKYFEYFLVAGMLIFLVFNFKKFCPVFWRAFLAAFSARFVIVEIIRFFWHRSRPFALQNFASQKLGEQVNLLISHSATPSFPSGHAAFYFALATVIYLYNKKVGIFFFVAAFLISLARIFVGIHWPSDILAGAVVGILCGWLIIKIPKKP